MRILITGGGGFVARNLYEYLKDIYYHVAAPSKQELDVCDTDMVRKYLKKHMFDIVIHVANYDGMTRYSTKDRNLIVEKNLRMFFNLVNHKHLFAKLICIGSGAEYDLSKQTDELKGITRFKETDTNKFLPNDPYGFSKYVMSKYAESNDFITVLRIFGVYGKYEDWRVKFISNACCKALSGLPITISQNRYMDYIYIDDLCSIINNIMLRTCKYRVYNASTNDVISLVGIAKYIEKNHATTSIETNILQDGLGPTYRGDNIRLKVEFPNITFTNHREGISNLYQWYLNNPDQYNKNFLKQQSIEIR